LGRFLSQDRVLGHLTAPQSLNRYLYAVNNPLRYVDPTGEDWWNPLTWGQDIASAVSSAAAAVGDWWSSSSIWDKLDAAMTIVGFIPGLDVISDAYFLGKAIVDVVQGRGSWADVAMNAAFLLLPAVGGAAAFKLIKKFGSVGDSAGDVAKSANKVAKNADAAKAVGKADNVGDSAVYIRYMTNDEYKHLGKTNELKFGRGEVFATTERVTTNAELAARGGIVQPKQWGVQFRMESGVFQPNGLAKYQRGHPLQGQEIPGGIPEFFSGGPVRVKEILARWPIS